MNYLVVIQVLKRIPRIVNLMKYFPKSELLNKFLKNHFYKFFKKFKLNIKYSGLFDYSRNYSSAFFLQRSLFLPHEINEIISPKTFKLGFDELNILEKLNDDVKDIEDEKLKILYLEINIIFVQKFLKTLTGLQCLVL